MQRLTLGDQLQKIEFSSEEESRIIALLESNQELQSKLKRHMINSTAFLSAARRVKIAGFQPGRDAHTKKAAELAFIQLNSTNPKDKHHAWFCYRNAVVTLLQKELAPLKYCSGATF